MSDDRLQIARIDAELWRTRARALEARYTKLARAGEAMLEWVDSGGSVYDELAAALALPEAEPTEEGETDD